MSELTREEKRILIAEACGWKLWQNQFKCWCVTTPTGTERALPGTPAQAVVGILDTMGLPDYFNDLNAMHEAEKKLSDAQWVRYCVALARQEDHLYGRIMSEVGASAAQRAEAFLVALTSPPDAGCSER